MSRPPRPSTPGAPGAIPFVRHTWPTLIPLVALMAACLWTLVTGRHTWPFEVGRLPSAGMLVFFSAVVGSTYRGYRGQSLGPLWLSSIQVGAFLFAVVAAVSTA